MSVTPFRPARVRRLVPAVVAFVAAGYVYGEAPPQSWPDPPAGSFAAATFEIVHGDRRGPVPGARVTAEFFPATKVQPLLGRLLTTEEYRPGASSVTVVSHAWWSDWFGSSPEVIGRTIDIDGRPVVIVGVMPRGFEGPAGARVWLPKVSE